jgi:glycosyltransferase involved in cell wall biosynthesis
VADAFPWPATNGGLIRASTAIEALADLGEVDLFCFFDQRLPGRRVPSSFTLARLAEVPLPPVHPSLLRRAGWLAERGVPLEVAMRSRDKAARREFLTWAAPRYDLAWFCSAKAYAWLGRPDRGPTVVDLIDLEDVKERQRAQLVGARPAHGVPAVAKRGVARAQAELNARDWSVFQRSVAATVDRVLLSSAVDVGRLGVRNADTVVNTFERPPEPVGRTAVAPRPTLLFPGTFDYAPNVDGATWLVHDILPLVHEHDPEAQARLVGRRSPGVEPLDDNPAVTVVGSVPSMVPELARADLVVVPLRMGSGTRLKILEAFAHRIPVVSTALGADGLDLEDDVHLLLADDPAQFAEACHRLLTEESLRSRLVDAAEDRFLRCFDATIARDRVRAVAREVTDVTGPTERR